MNSRLTPFFMKIIRLFNFCLFTFALSSHAQTTQEAINAAKNKDYDKACPAFQKNAQNNDVTAMSALSMCYLYGHHFQRNMTEALFWARKAADLNDPVGMGIAGTLYFRGAGVSKDLSLGVAYLEKAVSRGYLPAFQHLGEAYFSGIGVSQDYKRARSLLERAVLRESARANYQLGRIYEEGLGTNKDKMKAIEEYKKALKIVKPQESEDLNNPGRKLKDAIEERVKNIENDPEFRQSQSINLQPNKSSETAVNSVQFTQDNRQAKRAAVNNADDMKIFKDKCVELGFQNGTEAFGECVLKLSK
jgi:Sel1 repeat